VLDIDLAGRLYPRRGGEDIRVMNGGADWPRMRLRTRWSRMARVRSGDEQLANMNYMQRINRYWETDPLRYEKQMLDDWFDKTIVPKRHAERPAAAWAAGLDLTYSSRFTWGNLARNSGGIGVTLLVL
jgi:hypothetical protein